MTTNFGEKVKKLRVQKNLTQSQLAEVLSVGRSTIAGYETKGKQPDYDKLEKLATYFNVSIDYLLGYSKNHYSNTPILGSTLEKKYPYQEKTLHIDHELLELINKLGEENSNIFYKEILLKNSSIITLKKLLNNAIEIMDTINQLD